MRGIPTITVTLTQTGQWWLKWGRKSISALAKNPKDVTCIRGNVAAMTGDRRAFDAPVRFREGGSSWGDYLDLTAAEVSTWPAWKREGQL